MRSALLLALLLGQAAPDSQTQPDALRNFRYQRTIKAPATAAADGPVCVILDPAIFPHAGPSLLDLRLFAGSREVPYAITLSEPAQPDADTASIRNLGLRHRAIVFDLEMPHRPYTEILLNLAGQNFLAHASVSGTRNPNYSGQTHLGDFTLFDLTARRLARSTTLSLQETDLPYLHIELSVSPARGAAALSPQTLLNMVQGASVPPSREAQSLYTTAVTSNSITQHGRQSVAAFLLPERIPIERVSFDLPSTFKSNFSRDIHIADRPAPDPGSAASLQQTAATAQPGSAADNPSEVLAGAIYRVHLTQPGPGLDSEINQQQLSVPATLGSNMQSPAAVQVSVDNRDDTSLPLTAIRLEMRQRKLCFNPQSASNPRSAPNSRGASNPQSPAPSASNALIHSQNASPLILYYGNSALPAPQYDYVRIWNPAAPAAAAQLGPEQFNPAFRTQSETPPYPQRHPRLLWIALLATLGSLLLLLTRSSKGHHRR